ncbi:MAG: hypothetical protein ACOY0T_12780 [Myxococcota bacterium]
MTDALCRSDTSGYWHGRSRYFDELTELWTAFDDGVLIAFGGLRLLSHEREPIVYVDTLNVRPRSLGSKIGRYSLGTALMHEILFHYSVRFSGPPPFVFRTQNPHVYRLAHAMVPRGIHPAIGCGSSRQPERGTRLAAVVASQLSPNKVFDSDTLVIRGALGRSLYGSDSSAMRPTGLLLARYWKQNVHTTKGDALVVVVMPTKAEVAKLALSYGATVGRDKWQHLKDRIRSNAMRILPRQRRATRHAACP